MSPLRADDENYSLGQDWYNTEWKSQFLEYNENIPSPKVQNPIAKSVPVLELGTKFSKHKSKIQTQTLETDLSIGLRATFSVKMTLRNPNSSADPLNRASRAPTCKNEFKLYKIRKALRLKTRKPPLQEKHLSLPAK